MYSGDDVARIQKVDPIFVHNLETDLHSEDETKSDEEKFPSAVYSLGGFGVAHVDHFPLGW